MSWWHGEEWIMELSIDQIRYVQSVLNGVLDDIEEVGRFNESGKIDALNLMINATVYRMEHPGSTLREIVSAMYDEETTYEDVISWIRD
jgi:hypothetical protein